MADTTTTEKAWADLHHELDLWQQEARIATLWCRDDDAQHSAAALDRLMALSNDNQTPLVIAAIPDDIDKNLPQIINMGHKISVFQHGWSHQNHAPVPEKKCELGDHRPLSEVQHDMQAGAKILKQLFGDTFSLALVPPWNRIGIDVKRQLGDWGYQAVSTYGNADTNGPAKSHLQHINTHIDVIDWRGHRGFIGTNTALNNVTAHLRQRRTGTAPGDEVTGILTHHLVHDDPTWDFLKALFDTINAHDGAKWLTGKELLGD